MGPLLTMSALSEVQAYISNFWSGPNRTLPTRRLYPGLRFDTIRLPSALPGSVGIHALIYRIKSCARSNNCPNVDIDSRYRGVTAPPSPACAGHVQSLTPRGFINRVWSECTVDAAAARPSSRVAPSLSPGSARPCAVAARTRFEHGTLSSPARSLTASLEQGCGSDAVHAPRGARADCLPTGNA